MRMVSWNVNGARPKLPEFIHTVLHEGIHILFLQETNISSRGDRPITSTSGFQSFHTPIVDCARGLITLVHRSIPARQVDLLYNLGNHVERLSTEVYFDKKKYH